MKSRPNSARRIAAGQRGATMVESLVALLVLSVGMLGIAGLYVSSLRAERTAQLRTQAITLVNDMMDRIRANAQARGGYDLSKVTPGVKSCVAAETPTPCKTEDLALEDLKVWTDAAKDTLPGGKGTVTYAAGGGVGLPDTYTITVEWQEPGDRPDGGPITLQYKNTLSLIPVTP